MTKPIENLLQLITVYYNTMDYPGVYVARVFHIQNGMHWATKIILGPKKTLEEIRQLIPEGMVKLERDMNDDKNIIECWI